MTVVAAPLPSPSNIQLPAPSCASRSSTMRGERASNRRTTTDPPISADRSTPRSTDSALSIGPASDPATLASVTPSMRAPITGHRLGRTPPEIVRARPVAASNCRAARLAMRSAGSRNSAPTATTTMTTNSTISLTIQRIPLSTQSLAAMIPPPESRARRDAVTFVLALMLPAPL